MNFNAVIRLVQLVAMGSIIISCSGKRSHDKLELEIESLNLNRGEVTLCGSGNDQFGTVEFSLSCSEEVSDDFNLATALLHSFEYAEAEKVFAKVMDKDPECVMAYWGAAMCNFHPLWTPPTPDELQKGSNIITVGRTIVKDKSARESYYLEAIATIYDQWNTVDHRTRLLKFEKACEQIVKRYPGDTEAAIFYALALGAGADPADKTFANQKKAGDILNAIYLKEPNHPGITHYIIHNYDYPELAGLALPAARKYALIAAASAHAQHMPSHIFTRLGLWEESIQSNLKSISAAQCYAQNLRVSGHWDEELHGLDYLIYAYLQKADDAKALEQIQYLKTIKEVFPQNFKDAYAFAAIPARYALERRDWAAAAKLELELSDFPWNKFLWEKTNINFGRLLGLIHNKQLTYARTELEQIDSAYAKLVHVKENYKANLVLIQMKAGEGWIKLSEGQKSQAIKLMAEAAELEDATVKHPVTPGEIIPARELLGDMYMEIGDFAHAFEAYEADLKRHPNRFNGLYGAWLSSEKAHDRKNAGAYYKQLLATTNSSGADRPQMEIVESYKNKYIE